MCAIARVFIFTEHMIMMILICLMVEKAIIFFRSFSVLALILAIISVMHEIGLRILKIFIDLSYIFIIKYTPAVTNVEE